MRILCINLSVYVSVYVYIEFHICIDLCKCTCIYTPAAPSRMEIAVWPQQDDAVSELWPKNPSAGKSPWLKKTTELLTLRYVVCPIASKYVVGTTL